MVSNDTAFTFSTKYQSLIAMTTAFPIASPVLLGSLGTFKRRSTPRLETRIGKQSTFSWFPEISGSNFPSQWTTSGTSQISLLKLSFNFVIALSLCFILNKKILCRIDQRFNARSVGVLPAAAENVKSCCNLWTDDILWVRLFRFWCHGVIVRLDILIVSTSCRF